MQPGFSRRAETDRRAQGDRRPERPGTPRRAGHTDGQTAEPWLRAAAGPGSGWTRRIVAPCRLPVLAAWPVPEAYFRTGSARIVAARRTWTTVLFDGLRWANATVAQAGLLRRLSPGTRVSLDRPPEPIGPPPAPSAHRAEARGRGRRGRSSQFTSGSTLARPKRGVRGSPTATFATGLQRGDRAGLSWTAAGRSLRPVAARCSTKQWGLFLAAQAGLARGSVGRACGSRRNFLPPAAWSGLLSFAGSLRHGAAGAELLLRLHGPSRVTAPGARWPDLDLSSWRLGLQRPRGGRCSAGRSRRSTGPNRPHGLRPRPPKNPGLRHGRGHG